MIDMIKISHLNKKYISNNEYTLKDINISFEDTGLYYLIGKSGSGKTTLLSLIGAMDTDYEGKIEIDGKEIKDLDENQKSLLRFEKIAFVFQDYAAIEEETVFENLMKPLSICSYNYDEKTKIINEYLFRFGLDDKKDCLFKDISGGEKKRISLIRGLIRPSKILLVDEPVSSLNKSLRKEITDILIEESKRKTVIVITHEIDCIPKEATVYLLENGCVNLDRSGFQIVDKKAKINQIDRKFYSMNCQFKSIIHFTIRNIRFLSLVLFSLIIALFSSTLSFQLSSNVSSSLVSSLSNYMDSNNMVIENKDEDYSDTYYKTVDYNSLKHFQSKYNDMIYSINSFYLTSLNEIFQNNQSIKLSYQKNEISLPQLSLDTFVESILPEEFDRELSFTDFKTDEIGLILGEDYFKPFSKLVLGYYPEKEIESMIPVINSKLDIINLSLIVQSNQNEWSYHQNYSFRVKYINFSTYSAVISQENDFNEHFVKDILHFKERFEDDETSYPPWTLTKCYGLKIKKEKMIDFTIAYLNDPLSQEVTFEVLKDTKTVETRRLGFYKEYLPKLSVYKIKDKLKDKKGTFSDLCFSSPIYTYTASGYISGFLKPFFFSRYKDKLNQIIDSNRTSAHNLGSFQGSLIETDTRVLKADLLSSMNQSGLVFLSKDNKTLMYGKEPTRNNEIGVSVSFAKQLFKKETEALNQTLHVLTLQETVKEGDHFRNEFIESEMVIKGIYQSDKCAIFQDALFPLAYSYALGGFSKENLRITNAVVNVDLDKINRDDCERLFTSSREYLISFPMLEITNEINKTLTLLSNLFFGLSLLSFMSSAFLLTLSIYLILRKDKKNIGVLLSLGYEKREIVCYYSLFVGTLGTISYIFSLLFSLITEITLKKTLEIELNSYQSDPRPFLISLLLILVLLVGIIFYLYFSVRNIHPKDALKSENR